MGTDQRQGRSTVGEAQWGCALGRAGHFVSALGLVLLLGLTACGGGASGSSPATPDVADGLEALPLATNGSRAVRLWPAGAPAADSWCLHRAWPDETLQVVAGCGSTSPVKAPFLRGAEGELLALESWSDGQTFYLMTYDARRNIPSGRLPGVVSDGVDVLRFSLQGDSVSMSTLGTALPLGGFDNLIHAGNGPAGFTVCAVRGCHTLADGRPAVAWPTDRLDGYEFVEVLIDGNGVEALMRSVDDGYSGVSPRASFHYAHARLTPAGSVLARIDSDCLPFALSQIGWRCARTPQDMAELLRFDLARMPHRGVMDFGASNLEGRVAWSQAYYLNALAQLGGKLLPGLAAAGNWADLRQRAGQELALLARRETTAAGYASKRYSMQRSELTFALHLGRIARTLEVGADAGHDSSSLGALRKRLSARLLALDGTLERAASRDWQGMRFATLELARGADFWCDGANVPYNFVSANVLGLLANGSNEAQRQRAASLMAPLLALEGLQTADTWNYWWNQGFDGWLVSDDVSTHTPGYAGSRGRAHISYRSIDAAAVLRLAAVQADAVPAATVLNLRRLVANGGLLPWVNEELARMGSPQTLSAGSAYRHARATGTWEIQAQVWALDRLASAP